MSPIQSALDKASCESGAPILLGPNLLLGTINVLSSAPHWYIKTKAEAEKKKKNDPLWPGAGRSVPILTQLNHTRSY